MRCRQAMHCAISISQSSLAKFSERQGRRQLKAAYLRRQSHGMAQHAQNERSNPSALTQRERPALTLSGSRSSFGRLLAPLVMRTAGALDMSITSLMNSAAQFLAQFFPLFLLGALFGKLNGRHRLDRRHYSLHDRATWSSASDAGSRTGWRLGDVWRGQPVRRLLRFGAYSDRPRARATSLFRMPCDEASRRAGCGKSARPVR